MNKPCCTRQTPAHSQYLLEQITDTRRIQASGVCAALQADGLPCGLQPPYCLESICICEQVSLQHATGFQTLLNIPLELAVRDQCGTLSHIRTDWQFPVRLHPIRCDRCHVCAEIRLHTPVTSQTHCFQACVSLFATLYFTKHTAVCIQVPNCCAPLTNKPLYPQPPHHHC